MLRTALIFLAPMAVSFAGVIAGPNAGSFTTFIDTNTGYHWLTLDSLFGTDYPTQLSMLPAGFQVATFSQVDQLAQLSMPGAVGATWDSYRAIVGGSNYRQLIWGNYSDPGGSSPNGWYYAYRFGDWLYYNPGTTGADADLSIWAVNTGAGVPEPASVTLVAAAAAAAWALRRRLTANGAR